MILSGGLTNWKRSKVDIGAPRKRFEDATKQELEDLALRIVGRDWAITEQNRNWQTGSFLETKT